MSVHTCYIHNETFRKVAEWREHKADGHHTYPCEKCKQIPCYCETPRRTLLTQSIIKG